MNKIPTNELYRANLKNTELEDIAITSKGVKFKFSDSSISIDDKHSQDCCERVWADFSIIEYYIQALKGKEVKSFYIKGVKEMGVLLCFELSPEKGIIVGQDCDGGSIKIFVPCYNSQNGYYSSNLELVVKHKDLKTRVDISEMIEDNIY